MKIQGASVNDHSAHRRREDARGGGHCWGEIAQRRAQIMLPEVKPPLPARSTVVPNGQATCALLTVTVRLPAVQLMG